MWIKSYPSRYLHLKNICFTLNLCVYVVYTVKYHPVCLSYILQLCVVHHTHRNSKQKIQTTHKKNNIKLYHTNKKEKIESECKQNNMIMKICYVVWRHVRSAVRKIFLLRSVLTENFPALTKNTTYTHGGNQPTDRLMTTYYVGKHIYTF